jgi:hypothetical protein
MYFSLAVMGGLLGLVVLAAAVFTPWLLQEQWKQQRDKEGGQVSKLELARTYFMRWTALDYAIIGQFVIGLLFLLTDVIGVIRDRQSYPYYHFGYLLFGFIFSLLGMLFMLLRLILVLQVSRAPGVSTPDHHHKPNETNQAE